MKDEDLTRLFSSGAFSTLDTRFAQLMTRLNKNHVPELALGAALVSSLTRQGHICVDLRELGGKPLADGPEGFFCPGVSQWCEQLLACTVVGRPGVFSPLILDHAARLYLYRYWEYQKKLADALKVRIWNPSPKVDADTVRGFMERLFPPNLHDLRGTTKDEIPPTPLCQRGARGEFHIDCHSVTSPQTLKTSPCVPPFQKGGRGDFLCNGTGDIDWQRVAAFAAISKTFCVISGGPGTGKTTAVAKILALLLAQAPSNKPRIALTAPTGKAAARLQEAIGNVRKTLDCPESIRGAIPGHASTIHRLLGVIEGSPYFRYNSSNRLPVDILVVDEASMVDLALMSKLVQALPDSARLILLGDKDQLSSVEAGAVLGDICETGKGVFYSRAFAEALQNIVGCTLPEEFLQGNPAGESKDCLIQLQKSYRFVHDSGIGRLSRAAGNGDTDEVIALCTDGAFPDVSWNDMPPAKEFAGSIRNEIEEGFREYFLAVDGIRFISHGQLQQKISEIFDRFDQFRVLCAVREGFCGVSALNSLVEDIFEQQHLLKRTGKWYAGRPVLIGCNDYTLRLFNGDVGIFLPDTASGTGLRVFFPGPEGTLRAFHPLRLPEHETVYATTVHKSQGSEFTRVLLVLPDRDSPVLTRELVYTAITRAKERVSLWSPESILRTAVSRPTRRMSGLSEALWGSLRQDSPNF